MEVLKKIKAEKKIEERTHHTIHNNNKYIERPNELWLNRYASSNLSGLHTLQSICNDTSEKNWFQLWYYEIKQNYFSRKNNCKINYPRFRKTNLKHEYAIPIGKSWEQSLQM